MKKTFFIYLEPASSNLIDANKLWNGNNIPLRVQVTGQYYSGKGLPKNYQPKGNT